MPFQAPFTALHRCSVRSRHSTCLTISWHWCRQAMMQARAYSVERSFFPLYVHFMFPSCRGDDDYVGSETSGAWPLLVTAVDWKNPIAVNCIQQHTPCSRCLPALRSCIEWEPAHWYCRHDCVIVRSPRMSPCSTFKALPDAEVGVYICAPRACARPGMRRGARRWFVLGRTSHSFAASATRNGIPPSYHAL